MLRSYKFRRKTLFLFETENVRRLRPHEQSQKFLWHLKVTRQKEVQLLVFIIVLTTFKKKIFFKKKKNQVLDHVEAAVRTMSPLKAINICTTNG